MRSISLYGLSDVTLTFERRHRQLLRAPAGVRAVRRRRAARRASRRRSRRFLAVGADLPLRAGEPRPLARWSSRSSQDWVIERAYKSVPGVADDSRRSAARRCSIRCCSIRRSSPAPGSRSARSQRALGANNGNAGGGFYSEGGQFYYVRGLGRSQTPEDIGNVVLAVHDGTPVLVKDIGQVVHRHGAAARPVRLSTSRTTPSRASSCCAPASRRRPCSSASRRRPRS